jgi:hypothetical protein
MELDDVTEVMSEACPLEAELMGPAALTQIAAGRQYKPVAGGSHMNMMDAVSVLSCAATVAQLALQLWPPKKGMAFALPSDFDERLRSLLSEHAAAHPELMAALKGDGQLFQRLSGALRNLLTTR